MKQSQKHELRASEIRARLNELQAVEDLSTEQESEMGSLTVEYRTVETRKRAAIATEADEIETAKAEHGDAPDREMRERIELRSKASLGRYLSARAQGRIPSGAESELMEAAGVDDGIPLELWDTSTPEKRAVTAAPGTVGLNLDRIRPAVFAPSILPRLGVEMPRVPSGTYASATISASVTAGAVAKGADAPATAATFSVASATPKRVSARLTLALEDIAAVGQKNFESALRENLSLAISSELDDQGLNGVKADDNNNLNGLFQALTDPSAPAAGVAGFDAFVSAFAGGIDGLWASRMNEITIVAGPESYRLSAQTFRDAVGQDLGGTSFADYATERYGGWWTNKRMPAKDTHVQQAILYRSGRPGIRTATCPNWGRIGIDDVYSGSASGTRHFNLHVLLGDVIVVQPGAYDQIAFRVSV